MKGNPGISTYSDSEEHGAGTVSLRKPSAHGGTCAPAGHMFCPRLESTGSPVSHCMAALQGLYILTTRPPSLNFLGGETLR